MTQEIPDMKYLSGIVYFYSALGINLIERKDDYMKKLFLVLALVLSLALVGCQGPSTPAEKEAGNTMIETNPEEIDKTIDSTDAPAADAAMTVNLSVEDAVKVFTEKYAGAQIDDISFEMDNGSYVYEINGFDDANEYELEISAADGSIIKEKSEKDRDLDDKAIDLALLKNVNELIEDAKADAGEGFYLDSYSIDVEDRGNITKIDIELKNASGKDIEYEYNLETKELIKKDL